uniref:DRBM domain-containing protein n=2 Tax=Meloidogyne incognita group TaxID=654580 RepID=A0A914MGD8_MELIC
MLSEPNKEAEGPEEGQTTAYEYYKRIVNELNLSGAFYRQKDVTQAAKDFITSTNKDPVSLLNIYSTISGEVPFKFFEYELVGRPDKNKFLIVSELDGQPIFGFPSASKKDAKKTCAVCILEKLYLEQRLNCLSSTGRKLKHPNRHPRPLPFTPVPKLDEDLGKISAEFYQQPLSVDPQMALFAEDVDFDGPIGPKLLEMKQNFEEQNPMPLDYKDKEKYEDVRNRAFKLFCENAFWVELKLCEATIEKLNAAGMWHENWNSVAYVSQCIMRLNSWRIREMNEEQKQQQKETTEGQEKSEQMEIKEPKKVELPEYFVFTLPYLPPRYACVALFDEGLFHGQISNSKSKAKACCAVVIAQNLIEKGWTNLGKKKVERPKSVKSRPTQKKRKKEPSEEDLVSIETNSSGIRPIEFQPYQFLLTLHPNENLDPRTHFLLATHASKNATVLLTEICAKYRLGALSYNEISEVGPSYALEYEENNNTRKVICINIVKSQRFIADAIISPYPIPGVPLEVLGGPLFQARGVPEKNKKNAKASASRAALDILVRKGTIQINEQNFDEFKTFVKALFFEDIPSMAQENIFNENVNRAEVIVSTNS